MSLGIVVIGRNEGERLVNCLQSLSKDFPLVYVDSGSTDSSKENAENYGAHIVDLDLSKPFTAARARNAGFDALLNSYPELDFVFFVDGDCKVSKDWIPKAQGRLLSSPGVAVVCGRRVEINPKASIYNCLCDMEWNTPVGPALACGGDALYRVSAFKSVNGFDSSFIAGEEPELCFRLRQGGYSIERIDEVMTFHDADMTHLSQWWKRTERSGHAYFLGWLKHGRSTPEKFYAKEIKSIMAWSSFALGLLVSALFLLSLIPLIVFLIVWLLQIVRIALKIDDRLKVDSWSVRFFYASSIMFGKFAQALGVFRAWRKKRLGVDLTLVEYK